MDATLLARVQFALNISFHYLFPPLSIGLGLILVIMEGLYLWTKNAIYERMTKFWVKIFALIFALGVGTGLVQVFSFGTNWANFSRYVGDVFGSLLGAEGIFAFFLEAGFLSVLLFGWERVSPKIHFLSTCLVSVGAHFSAIWIVFANSWMQTPGGHKVVLIGKERHAVISRLSEVIFNASSLDRLLHVLLGCWISGAFLVISVSAFYLLKNRHLEFAKRSLQIGIWVGALSLVLQLFSADISARGVAKNQPIKLAAFEGVYKTSAPTGMYAFGVVNKETQEVKGLYLPGLLSFLVYRNWHEGVAGLDQYPKELWPNVPVVFQTYHGMILLWGVMTLLAVWGWIVWRRRTFMNHRFLLRCLVPSVCLPLITNELGWYSAEMGRQPWSVYGELLTRDAASPHVSAQQILVSLILYAFVYLLLFALFLYLLDQKIRHGPPEEEGELPYRNVFKLMEK